MEAPERLSGALGRLFRGPGEALRFRRSAFIGDRKGLPTSKAKNRPKISQGFSEQALKP